jgi:hypothetical protein
MAGLCWALGGANTCLVGFCWAALHLSTGACWPVGGAGGHADYALGNGRLHTLFAGRHALGGGDLLELKTCLVGAGLHCICRQAPAGLWEAPAAMQTTRWATVVSTHCWRVGTRLCCVSMCTSESDTLYLTSIPTKNLAGISTHANITPKSINNMY